MIHPCHVIRFGLWAALVPALGFAQGTPPRPAKAAATPAYRGLTPGLSYRAFVERAAVLADHDALACKTSRQTAALMECGVTIRDPADGARFYLSGHFVDQRADIIALYDSAGFHDATGPALLARRQRDMTKVFGRPRRAHPGMWKWSYGRQEVRLSWRSRGPARWVAIQLTDWDVMAGTSRYVKPAATRKP
jgi:hypothetical protein